MRICRASWIKKKQLNITVAVAKLNALESAKSNAELISLKMKYLLLIILNWYIILILNLNLFL